MSAGMVCVNITHDHFHWPGAMLPDGTACEARTAMVCADCGQPAHYETDTDVYRHDDAAAPECFLVHGAGTPCTLLPAADVANRPPDFTRAESDALRFVMEAWLENQDDALREGDCAYTEDEIAAGRLAAGRLGTDDFTLDDWLTLCDVDILDNGIDNAYDSREAFPDVDFAALDAAGARIRVWRA